MAFYSIGLHFEAEGTEMAVRKHTRNMLEAALGFENDTYVDGNDRISVYRDGALIAVGAFTDISFATDDALKKLLDSN